MTDASIADSGRPTRSTPERDRRPDAARAADDTGPRTGVLFVNLGTPDSPSVPDVRRYLRQFLSDPRVVDLPRVLWYPILYGIILPVRGPKSAHAYAQVWTSEGSPLYAISKRQAARLAHELGPRFDVELAMRYGNPSIEAGLRALVDRGAKRVLVLTAFPQYSDSTVGSVVAEVERVTKRLRPAPRVETIEPWYADEGYVNALARTCREFTAGAPTGSQPDSPADPIRHWVFSFHGLPKRYVDRGDPYRTHCEATAARLARAMQLEDGAWTTTFQSRFGPEPWLEPYTDKVVPDLVARHGRVAIAMPGFTADCLETIEEIGIRLVADCAGKGELVVVPCLNDDAELGVALARLVRARDAASRD